MITDSDKIRIDKWLWAARFFKTRALAADAVESGKVLINETRVKPAKTIAVGNALDIRIGQYHFAIEVMALSARRGSAPEAQKLYRESEASRAQREALAAQLKAQPVASKGRPTKRDRRVMERLKQG